MEERRSIAAADAADVVWRPPESVHHTADGQLGTGSDLLQLKAWLRRIEADLHAAWLDCTTTASQDLHESLEAALRVMDARLARAVEAGLGTSVESGLARSQDGLREELSGLIASSLADLDEVVSAARRDWAKGSDDQAAALQALRELTERLADSPPPGQAAAEVKAGLETGFAGVAQRLVDELSTRTSMLQADVQNSLATVRGEQHELRERLARIEMALGNLASNLGAQLQRGRQASEERLVAAATSAVKEANKKLSQELANGRASVAAVLESRLGEVTKKMTQEMANGRTSLVADLEARLAEATKKVTEEASKGRTSLMADVEARLGDVAKQIGADVATGQASLVADLEARLGEATNRISEELAAASTMLQADVEAKLSGQLDGAIRHIAERLGSDLDAVRMAQVDQARVFEEALMALAKAVSDERRTSAALVKAALAATDETVRSLAQRVDRLTAGAEMRVTTRV